MARPTQFAAYLALAAVCFFWGTTYLAIRMSVESLPPQNLVAIRYMFSGTALLAIAKFSRASLPTGKELLYTSLCGLLIIGIGNGSLCFAELWVPSGLASLYLTTSPFWMIGVEALVPGGQRLHGPTIAGMLVGFAGTVLLVLPDALRDGFGGPMLRGFLILQIGAAAWAAGSIFQRRIEAKAHPVVSGAVQQLATGLVYLGPAVFWHSKPIVWTHRSAGAVLYLVIFGSIVGYSAFIYALTHLPVSVVTIYNYVNPIVAVLLGWIIYHEQIGAIELTAMTIIFVGVALVKHYAPPSAPSKPAAAPSPTPLRASVDS